METMIFIIIGILIWTVIHQELQIRKLRRQTIQAFLKVCEKAFKKGGNKNVR